MPSIHLFKIRSFWPTYVLSQSGHIIWYISLPKPYYSLWVNCLS